MKDFDERIKKRIQNDTERLGDSFLRMAGVVLGKWSASLMHREQLQTMDALNAVLDYYHEKPAVIPDEITDPADQIDFCLRPLGMMTREVELKERWHSCAYGPMLGCMKETGTPVALLPGKLSGYYYKDQESGKRVRITKKNENMFMREALCFYKPLPMKKLGIPDLLIYMKSCLSYQDIFLIVLATMAVTLVGFIEPRIYNLIIGPVLSSNNFHLLAGMGVFLICAAFASQMIGMVKTLLLKRITTKASVAVQSSVTMRILSLQVNFFRKYSAGDLSRRAGSISTLCNTILELVLSTGLSGLMSLLYITQIFAFAPALTLPAVMITVTTVLVGLITSVMQVRITRQCMELEAQEAGMNYAFLNGIQKIRLAGAEKRVFTKWGELFAEESALTYNPPAFIKYSSVITTGISLIGTVVLYYLAIKTGVETNQYFAFTAAYGRLSGAIAALAGIAATVAQVRSTLEMAEPILKAEPEISEDKEPVSSVSGDVEISHVSFRYKENAPYVLKDFSMKIEPGEYVAVAGRTGCGKSTLIRLLLGFEKPESGTVYYGKRDLAHMDLRTLRKQIGVVLQDGELFTGDIFSNITISDPELSVDEAWEAAELAGIAEDIRTMPMGMHTMISEGGGGISGGQKQRLMIARAIAPKPKILIFDEATSALDNRTQKQVSEALDRMGCTRIVIAHRLSTIQNCDRILVMDDGSIIEEGTFEQLSEKDGVFAELVARQRLDS